MRRSRSPVDAEPVGRAERVEEEEYEEEEEGKRARSKGHAVMEPGMFFKSCLLLWGLKGGGLEMCQMGKELKLQHDAKRNWIPLFMGL